MPKRRGRTLSALHDAGPTLRAPGSHDGAQERLPVHEAGVLTRGGTLSEYSELRDDDQAAAHAIMQGVHDALRTAEDTVAGQGRANAGQALAPSTTNGAGQQRFFQGQLPADQGVRSEHKAQASCLH